MSDVVLGQLITGEAERDAIHVAVFPAIAGVILSPGTKVGFLEDGSVGVCLSPIGIVDPFLGRSVERGEKFYVMLFPNTVTGMRHHWEHPALTEAERAASERWLRDFIGRSDCPDYDTVIAAATGAHLESVDEGRAAYSIAWGCLCFNGRDAHGSIPPEFWNHVEIVTGIQIPSDKRPSEWSCSC